MNIDDVKKNIGQKVILVNTNNIGYWNQYGKILGKDLYIKDINYNKSVNIVDNKGLEVAVNCYNIELKNEIKGERVVYKVKIKTQINDSIEVKELCIVDDLRNLIGYEKIVKEKFRDREVSLYIKIDEENIDYLIQNGELFCSCSSCYRETSSLHIIVEKIAVVKSSTEFMKMFGEANV